MNSQQPPLEQLILGPRPMRGRKAACARDARADALCTVHLASLHLGPEVGHPEGVHERGKGIRKVKSICMLKHPPNVETVCLRMQKHGPKQTEVARATSSLPHLSTACVQATMVRVYQQSMQQIVGAVLSRFPCTCSAARRSREWRLPRCPGRQFCSNLRPPRRSPRCEHSHRRIAIGILCWGSTSHCLERRKGCGRYLRNCSNNSLRWSIVSCGAMYTQMPSVLRQSQA